MKTSRFIHLFLLLFEWDSGQNLCESVLVNQSIKPRRFNVTSVNYRDYSFVVAIILYFPIGIHYLGFGSIIDSKWIITTASAIHHEDEDQDKLAFRITPLSNPDLYIRIRSYGDYKDKFIDNHRASKFVTNIYRDQDSNSTKDSNMTLKHDLVLLKIKYPFDLETSNEFAISKKKLIRQIPNGIDKYFVLSIASKALIESEKKYRSLKQLISIEVSLLKATDCPEGGRFEDIFCGRNQWVEFGKSFFGAPLIGFINKNNFLIIGFGSDPNIDCKNCDKIWFTNYRPHLRWIEEIVNSKIKSDKQYSFSNQSTGVKTQNTNKEIQQKEYLSSILISAFVILIIILACVFFILQILIYQRERKARKKMLVIQAEH